MCEHCSSAFHRFSLRPVPRLTASQRPLCGVRKAGGNGAPARFPRRFVAAAALLVLAGIALATTAAADSKGTVEGTVSPAAVRAYVVARPVERILGPAVVVPQAGSTQADPSGKYRLELDEGEYILIAHAPGYVDSREDPQPQRITVKAGETTPGPNFELMQAGTIEGVVRGLELGAIVVATRRAPVPREKRSWRSARVAMDNGQYQITELKPGVYDLLFVSSQIGLIDCRGSLLGEADTLPADDRKAIEAVNRTYCEARRRNDSGAALAALSTSYSDVEKQTYDTAKKRLEVLLQRKDLGWETISFTWKMLLLQGTRSQAIAVVHEVQRQSLRGVKQPPLPSDILVQYAKEGGAWRIRSIEPIREYTGLESRIGALTGEPCVLADNYVTRYSGDSNLGGILLASGEKSRGHDFDLPALLGKKR